MRKLLLLSASAIAFFCNVLQAEIYKDFLPFITLKQVKLNYPNAKFEDTKPAWANEEEALYRMTGDGLTGTIVLKFTKHDKEQSARLAENEAKSLNDNSEALLWWINYDKTQLALPLEERLTLSWVRFVPYTEIPYERLIGRYGKPEKCDSTADDFIPYCSWESKGVQINLSDNKKLVQSIEYTFTNEDIFPSLKQKSKTSLKKKTLKPKVNKD